MSMKILNSATSFRKRYATQCTSLLEGAKAVGGGTVAAGGMVAASALAVGSTAAHASAWSWVASWPLIGSLAAGKATSVGIAASLAAVGSVAVVVPALVVGGGVAYVVYRNRSKKTIHGASRVEDLAHAFARVAWLPMLALAVTVCQANPANRDEVENYMLREMGAWGYAESYVRDTFAKAMKSSPGELRARYGRAMGRLASGSTKDLGVSSSELPADVVRGFAEDFRRSFESNLA